MTRRAIVQKAALVGYEAGYRDALVDLHGIACETRPGVASSQVIQDVLVSIGSVQIMGDKKE